MFLFVLADQEPSSCSSLEVERASSTVSFPVVGYVDSENPWKKIQNALPQHDFKRVAVEFDNLILTNTMVWKRSLKPLSLKTSLLASTHAPQKSADEVQKMIVAGIYADKAVNVGLTIFLLIRLGTDIIANRLCHETWRLWNELWYHGLDWW